MCQVGPVSFNGGPGVAVAATRSVGGYQLRGEFSLRKDPADDGPAVRLAVGADRRFGLAGRDLYVILEYQHDDFGASDAADLTRVLRSEPYRDGEMQVLGEDEIATQGSWQIHPLWSVDLLAQINLRDGSGLIAPGGSYSIDADVSLRGGIYFSYGNDTIDLAPVSLRIGIRHRPGHRLLLGFLVLLAAPPLAESGRWLAAPAGGRRGDVAFGPDRTHLSIEPLPALQ